MSYGSKQLSVAPYRECPKPTVLVYQSLDPAMCESALVECDNILTSAPSLIATSDSSCSHGRKCPMPITTCITASTTPFVSALVNHATIGNGNFSSGMVATSCEPAAV